MPALLGLLLLLGGAANGFAQEQVAWPAQWIGVELEGESSPPNQWLCFRGRIVLEEVPEPAVARVAVDSRYWLWVNGNLAVFEGGLKRGPTREDSYYDEIDLGPYLHEGPNLIAVLVWHFGKHGFSHNNSGRAGLYFDLAGGSGSSAENWRAREHPAYGVPDPYPPFPNYRLPESDLRYDARLAIGDWWEPDHDDRAWPEAVELGRPPCEPWNSLHPRPTPQLRDSGLREYVDVEIDELEDGGRLVRCRLPVNTTIHPWLRVRARAGLSIDVRTDNYKSGGGRNLRYQYVTREGLQEYEGLSYFNGHEVHYRLPSGVEWLAGKYRETRYDTDLVGEFECEQPFYLELRTKAANTMLLNMRDGIQDPDRERAQWWGDVVNVIPQLFVNCDERAHPLVAKAIRNLIGWQRADGSLYSPVPAGNWNRELPLQMLASVGEYGIGRYVLYSADFELLREVYPGLLRYIDLWELDQGDLVQQRPGEWTWMDWGRHKDQALLYDAWYHLALRGMAQLATWMKDEPRQRATEELLRRHAPAFQERYWTGSEFRSPDHEGPADDRGNALAVLAGLHQPEHAIALERLLLRNRFASPYMERFVLEALFELGDGRTALKRMRARYALMVMDEATTLWERWDRNPKHSGYNHAWSGSPLHLLSEQVAGITPIEAGYRRFRVRPKLGPLRNVRASVPTVAGLIQVHIESDSESIELELRSPDNTIPLVELPTPAGGPWSRVFLDEQLHWERVDGELTPPPSFEPGSGLHRLRAEL